jgi:CRP/FNR family transcriptional activator FtrB
LPVRADDIEVVRRLALFADLPSPVFDRLIQGAFVQALPRGVVLCKQGETPEFLHAVLSGRVTLLGAEPERGETVVEFFEAGDILVAPAVMLDAPYLMSARMAQDGRILFVPAADVRQAMKAAPEFTYALAMQLARYWRRLIRQIKDLKLHQSAERLAAYLVALAPSGVTTTTIELPEDRKLVAARLGMTPESLSRAFVVLRQFGVGGRGRNVDIGDLARLRLYCRYDDVL